MIIFPLIYLSSFFFTVKEFLKGNKETIFLFLIFGLSIYTTSISVIVKLGLNSYVGFFQSFKEIIIISLLGWCLYTYKEIIKLERVDYLILIFFLYTTTYALLPIGEQSLINRLFAFKSVSFFAIIYFAGRFLNLNNLFLNKYFFYVLLLAICAAIVVVYEFFTDQHLQTKTGYAEFNYYLFNFEPTGRYGLSWTFETTTGFKRFASFFSNPLEHAAATLISIAVLISFYTDNDYKIKLDSFGIIALVATLTSILLAVSRSSFASYFIIIYAYGWISNKKYIPKTTHLLIIIAAVYLLYSTFKNLDENNNLLELIIGTLNFSDASSMLHVIEWVQGITAIYQNPLGLGLGSSGSLAGSLGENIGGENQFIIIGVQAGIIALIIYIAIYITIIKTAKYWYYRLDGKEKKLCLALLLIKIGFIVPLLTSEIETSTYITYMIWFLTGIFINIVAKRKTELYG
jgi:hypothetical protein